MKKRGFILYIVVCILLGLAILAFALNDFKRGAVTQLAKNVDQNRLMQSVYPGLSIRFFCAEKSTAHNQMCRGFSFFTLCNYIASLRLLLRHATVPAAPVTAPVTAIIRPFFPSGLWIMILIRLVDTSMLSIRVSASFPAMSLITTLMSHG